ncbi:unnamed protein product [Haemonchus placei]|uniref:Uncharacterized protein n=1 Tax=Haemonchus placei TaxID=6290 RepID=A0A0N4WVP2_HAEPC|nr:unnamed protein product [Haemonchus placei]
MHTHHHIHNLPKKKLKAKKQNLTGVNSFMLINMAFLCESLRTKMASVRSIVRMNAKMLL